MTMEEWFFVYIIAGIFVAGVFLFVLGKWEEENDIEKVMLDNAGGIFRTIFFWPIVLVLSSVWFLIYLVSVITGILVEKAIKVFGE